MRRRFGAVALTLAAIVVIAVVVSVPLFTIYKSTCREGDRGRRAGTEARYSFVLPWNDPPKECRNHRNGLRLVRDELGLD